MKKHPRLVAPLLIVLFLVLACAREKSYKDAYNFGTPTPASVKSTPPPVKSTPPPPSTPRKTEAADIIQLANKPPEAVNALLGQPIFSEPAKTKPEEYRDYQLSAGRLDVTFRNGRAKYFHFEASDEKEKFTELASLLGIDLQGIVPVASNAVQVTWKSETIDGVTFKEIRAVVGSNSLYKILTLEVE